MKFGFVLAAAASCSAAYATPALSQQLAQHYPNRPVRVLVGLAPGGGTDSVARLITQKLADTFGQTFVVDNRPGASGNVAGEMAARAAPDGYTLIIVTPTYVINPSRYRTVLYDAVKDFAGIAQIVDAQYYLSVANNVPVASVKELIALAKTPAAIIERLNSAINRALPELRERYAALGMYLAGGSAGKFGALLRSERDKWAKVVKLSGVHFSG